MTTDGIHDHPLLMQKLSEFTHALGVLDARVAALETPVGAPPTVPTGYGYLWPVVEAPRPLYTHTFSDLASLRDVARNGGYRITLPAAVRNSGEPLEVGPDTIIASAEGCTWTG